MTLATIQPLTRLILSAGIIFGVLAAVAATSSAIFSTDPATITGNTFATGGADLLIAAPNGSLPGTYGTSIQGADISGMMPGEEKKFDFWLKNASQGAVELDLTAELTQITFADSAEQPLSTNETELDTTLTVLISCDVSNASLRDGASTTKNLATWQSDGVTALDQTTSISTNATPGRLGENDGTDNGVGSDEAKCTMTAKLDPNSNAKATATSFNAQFVGTQSEEE